MKQGLKNCFVLSLFFVLSIPAQADDWKGKPDESEMSLGALTGMGIIDSSVGFAVLGTASKKIVRQGFVPDLNDSVSLEGAVGPVFISGVTALAYNIHLRWDFDKDPTWTFYALGGVGGNMMTMATVNRFELFPRVGVGAFWKVSPLVHLRAEVSHELIGVGVLFPI